MTKVNLDLVESKEFRSFAKEVGEKQAKELLEKSDDDLKSVISAHTVSMAQAEAETKSADAYIKAAEVKKDFEKALRERNKPLQKAVKLAAKVLYDRKNA